MRVLTGERNVGMGDECELGAKGKGLNFAGKGGDGGGDESDV